MSDTRNPVDPPQPIGHSRLRVSFAICQTLLASAVLLVVVRTAIRRTPLPRVRAWLRRTVRTRRGPSVLTTAQVARCVTAVGRRMPGIGTCLTHAIVAEVLLRREHHRARIVIGIERHAPGAIRAHAWVESSGTVVVGAASDLDRYTPIVSRGTPQS